MKNIFSIGVLFWYLTLEFVFSTFVFGSKEDKIIFPKELLNLWLDENEYGGIYSKSDMFTVIILPDCEDNDFLEITIRNLLMTSNRNLLHEILVLLKNCNNSTSNSKNIIENNILNIPPVKFIETELEELGDLQNLGVSFSSGEIILFIPVATLFPKNWMSVIMRSLSDYQKSIVVPMLRKIDKNHWNFSPADHIYSPKIVFSKNDFELSNFYTPSNDVIFFFSTIFAIKKSWWDIIAKFSDPMINLIFKKNINLDIALRSWNCGGKVIQTKDLAFGVTKIKNFQPSFEMKQILLESWIDKTLITSILKNSDKLTQFINDSSNYMLKSLILKRNEFIENSNCKFNSFLTSKFNYELNYIGLINYPKTQIEFKNTNLCFTPMNNKKNDPKLFILKLSTCHSENESQLFFIDNKQNMIRHLNTNTCITVFKQDDKANSNQYLTLGECNQINVYTQIEYWKDRLIFASYCVQADEYKKDLFISRCLGEDQITKYLQYFNIKSVLE